VRSLSETTGKGTESVSGVASPPGVIVSFHNPSITPTRLPLGHQSPEADGHSCHGPEGKEILGVISTCTRS